MRSARGRRNSPGEISLASGPPWDDLGRTPGGGEEERAERSSQALRGPRPKVGLTVTDALRKAKSSSCVSGGYCPEPLTQARTRSPQLDCPSGPRPEVHAGKCSPFANRRCGAVPQPRARESCLVAPASWGVRLMVRPLGEGRAGRMFVVSLGKSQPHLLSPPALGSSASAVRTRESPPSIMGISILWGLTVILC